MVEEITQEEFEQVAPAKVGGRIPRPEVRAVQALTPMHGVKFPCWAGHHEHTCKSLGTVRQAATRKGFRISGACRNGRVYVFRYE